MFGGMFGSGQRSDAPLPTFTDDAPSWEKLDARLRELEPREERNEFDLKKEGRGGSNHKANLRLFDAPEGTKPLVTLYRDQAAWCPYSFKTWYQIEEKRIPYEVVKNPLSCYGSKSPEFFRVSPSGQMPVAIIKGRVVSESSLIMEQLEAEFPSNNPLLPPAGSKERERVAVLLRLERRLFSSWFSWLTSRASGGGAAKEMDELFKLVDAELKASGGPYFLGPNLSLVDVIYSPFLERMAASLPYFKGFEARSSKYPHLLRWYESMDLRPAYAGIKSDYYTHCHDLPPQIGNCFFTPEAQPFTQEIDGGCWDVSKDPATCLEPMLPADPLEARRDAVRNLLDNHDNVVKFACRGAGSEGVPAVRAELADPNASPNLSLVPPVDYALRIVVHNLLETSPTSLRKEGLPAPDKLAQCLAYLRDRVGVPRDMTVHGARQFRAFLNLAISQL